MEAKISDASVQNQIEIQVEQKNVMLFPVLTTTLVYTIVNRSSIFAPVCLTFVFSIPIAFGVAAQANGICRSTGGAVSLSENICTSEKYDYTTNPTCTCPQTSNTTRGKLKCFLQYDPGPGLLPIKLYGCQ